MVRFFILICSLSIISCNKKTVEITRTEYKDKLIYVDKLIKDSTSKEKIITIERPVEVLTPIPCGEDRKPSTIKAGKTDIDLTPNNKGGYDLNVKVKGDTCTYEKNYKYIKEKYDSLVLSNHTLVTDTITEIEKPVGFFTKLGLKFYQLLSLILLGLWVLGLTPRYIIGKILSIISK